MDKIGQNKDKIKLLEISEKFSVLFLAINSFLDKTRSKQVELYLFAVKCIIHGKLRILTGKTHPKKSRTLTKRMYICIWVVDTSKQLFIIGSYSSYTETKFPKK